jgi:Pyruvate/2-oxoacid:ferredoxin oxidoreductase delta subunit
MAGPRRSRRELLTGWIDGIRRGGSRPVGQGHDPDRVLRPPGALSPDEAFLEACTGCADCVPACPARSIVMLSTGSEGRLPAISPTTRPCYLCHDLPCVVACPDGALRDPGGPPQVRMGIARVDPRRCVTFRGQRCDRCSKCCPIPQAITLIGGRPLVASGLCTGCGLCEYVCPEHPKAIEVVAERLLVPGLRVPRQDYR